MFSLTKKVEFALIILKHFEERSLLAAKKNREEKIIARANEIANAYKISESFVAKIMQKLNKHEILFSIQGAQGGYYVKESIEGISLLTLMEILEGRFTIVNCINEDKECIHNTGCSIIDPMRNLNNRFRDIYQNITVGEILQPVSTNESEYADTVTNNATLNKADSQGSEQANDFFMQ